MTEILKKTAVEF